MEEKDQEKLSELEGEIETLLKEIREDSEKSRNTPQATILRLEKLKDEATALKESINKQIENESLDALDSSFPKVDQNSSN